MVENACKSCNFGTPDLYDGYCYNCYRVRNETIREIMVLLIDMLGTKRREDEKKE